VGKLPGATVQQAYELEYGQAILEVQRDAIAPGERILVVDDVLATGGTLAATHALLEHCGATVVATAVLIELGHLNGSAKLDGRPLSALMTL
jgi:adenine phosphoribosyltransferase